MIIPVSCVRDLFLDSASVIMATGEQRATHVVNMARRIHAAFAAGHKLLICGNGGSASQADHLAAEFLVRLRPDIDRGPLPALSLNLDPSSMTACGNDYSYSGYFARMVRALGKEGDVLLAISTSGSSPNIHLAIQAAKSLGLLTMGLFGEDAPAAKECAFALEVPSKSVARIQESHQTVCHAIAEIVEDMVLADERV